MNKVDIYRKQNEEYKGRRIKCINMVDKFAVPSGTLGTVRLIDDTGTIHVNWDNGRTLGIVPEEDSYEFVKEVNSPYICGCCGDHVDKVTFNEEKDIDECELCNL